MPSVMRLVVEEVSKDYAERRCRFALDRTTKPSQLAGDRPRLIGIAPIHQSVIKLVALSSEVVEIVNKPAAFAYWHIRRSDQVKARKPDPVCPVNMGKSCVDGFPKSAPILSSLFV